ncbi:MAG: hypothetical protein AAGD96_33060 [Chloroflexota bacterium]
MVIKSWRSKGEKAFGEFIIGLLIIIGFPFLFFSIIPIQSALNAAFDNPTIFAVLGFGILIGVLVIVLALNSHRNRDIDYMIVAVDPNKAIRVIENSLTAKNFPFTQSKSKFRLKSEDLLIQVKHQQVGGNGSSLQGSSISIGPISKSNFEIAQSLKSRIEDGFQLKGLD